MSIVGSLPNVTSRSKHEWTRGLAESFQAMLIVDVIEAIAVIVSIPGISKATLRSIVVVATRRNGPSNPRVLSIMVRLNTKRDRRLWQCYHWL